MEGVGAAVILAANQMLGAAAERDGPGAMPANVAKRAKSFLFACRGRPVPYDQQRFAHNFRCEKRFRVRNGFLDALATTGEGLTARVIEGAGQLPGAAKDFFLFNFQNGWIGVKARSGGVCAFNLLVDV